MNRDDRDPKAAPEHAAPSVRLALARLAILWEQLWPAVWPALALALAFVILALFDLFRLLPGWLHLILLVLFGGAAAYALARGLWAIRRPGIAVARRRLERASGLVHRPLTALSDRLASDPDPAAAALWQAHRARMEASTRRLR